MWGMQLEVMANSDLCVQCGNWIHSRYAGVRLATQREKEKKLCLQENWRQYRLGSEDDTTCNKCKAHNTIHWWLFRQLRTITRQKSELKNTQVYVTHLSGENHACVKTILLSSRSEFLDGELWSQSSFCIVNEGKSEWPALYDQHLNQQL